MDTKDRAVAGSLMSVYDAALNGLTDELLKRWESLSAREARFDGQVAAPAAAHDELRASLATVQQSTFTLKRELERVLAGATPAAAGMCAAPTLDSYKYVGFEDQFRGSQDEIRARLELRAAVRRRARRARRRLRPRRVPRSAARAPASPRAAST